MAIEIPTNTALYIPVGPFLDKTDGITPELSITVANSAITLIAGASDETAPTVVLDSVAGNDATNTLVHITGDDAGMHYLKLTAANNNRYGKGVLVIEDTDTYVTVFHEIQWVSAQYYNMKYGTTILNTNTTQWEGHAVHGHTVEGLPVVQIHSAGTDGGISAPANFEDLAVTDTTGLVALANDSIKADTFDETTAFPLKSADTGATQVFRTGADSDTGETLSDQLDTAKTILDKVDLSASTIVSGEAQAGTLSTTEMTTNLTEATNDHYNGRIIIWTSGVLQNQATDITDYDGATKKLVYTAVTESPTAADTFIIV